MPCGKSQHRTLALFCARRQPANSSSWCISRDPSTANHNQQAGEASRLHSKPPAPSYALPCYAVLCHAVLCCAMLCCAVTCCAVYARHGGCDSQPAGARGQDHCGEQWHLGRASGRPGRTLPRWGHWQAVAAASNLMYKPAAVYLPNRTAHEAPYIHGPTWTQMRTYVVTCL